MEVEVEVEVVVPVARQGGNYLLRYPSLSYGQEMCSLGMPLVVVKGALLLLLLHHLLRHLPLPLPLSRLVVDD